MKYSTRVLTGAPASAAAYCAIRSATAAAKQGSRPRIGRLVCIVGTAVQADVAIYRLPNANYGTQNLTQLGQSLQNADPASGTSVDYGWSAQPTLPGGAVPIDGTRIAGTVGSGYIFTFPDPIILEPDTALVLWNPAGVAGPALIVVPTWDE